MNKMKIINFRVTESEASIIEKNAKTSGKTVSNYVRDCALWKEIQVVDNSVKILQSVIKITSELNELKVTNPEVDFDIIESEAQKLWLLLKQ